MFSDDKRICPALVVSVLSLYLWGSRIGGYFNRVHALPPSTALLILHLLPVGVLEEKMPTPSWSRSSAEPPVNMKQQNQGDQVFFYLENMRNGSISFPPKAKVTKTRAGSFHLHKNIQVQNKQNRVEEKCKSRHFTGAQKQRDHWSASNLSTGKVYLSVSTGFWVNALIWTWNQ